MICALIPAAGAGKRTGLKENKMFYIENGEPIIRHTVEIFRNHPLIDGICVVISPKDETKMRSILGESIIYAYGGETRGDSVQNGLNKIKDKFDKVLVHDGARPYVDNDTITRVINGIGRGVGAIACVPVTDTVKCVDDDGYIKETPDRSGLFAAQTPQGFYTSELSEAYIYAGEASFTDDAAVFEHFGKKVLTVEGNYANKKITTREDVLGGQIYLSGIGIDTHRLTEGRKLILGGVEVPHSLGLLGHSDADVLLHAIMDAMLGGASLGDIGRHFPDTDEKYRGISSIKLLEKVTELLKVNGFEVVNISAVITAQKPKLKDYIPQMNANIAKCVGIPLARVNVAATTTEQLGYEGRCEGISSTATVTLRTMG